MPAPLRPMISSRSPRSTVKLDVLEHGRAAVGLGQAVRLEHDPARVGRRREPDLVAALLGRPGDGRGLQPRHPLVERLGHPGPLGRLVAHGVGQGAEPADLGLLAVGQPGQAHLVGGPGGAVLGVGALVLDHLALVEVQDPGDGLVEQVEVVADDQQGAAVAGAGTPSARPWRRLSRWLVGSSSSSTSLPAKRMRASSTRRRSPPDSTVMGRSTRSAPSPRPAAMRRTSASAA